MGGGIPQKNFKNKIEFWTRAQGGWGPCQFVKNFTKYWEHCKSFILSVFLGDIIWIKEIYDGMEAVKKQISCFGGGFGCTLLPFLILSWNVKLFFVWKRFCWQPFIKVKKGHYQNDWKYVYKNKHLSKFTEGGRGLIAWTFCQKRKSSK